MPEREKPDFGAMLEQARADGARAALELQELSSEVSAASLFAALFADLVLTPAGTANEITHASVPIKSELLAFHLLPFFGTARDQSIDAFHISRALGAVDLLFDARQRTSMFAKLHQSRTADRESREVE